MEEKYLNRGKPWLKEEDMKLFDEYNNQKMDIMRIAAIHKRTPSGISSRLKHLQLVDKSSDVRGYEEYLNSDMRNELFEYKKNKKINKFNDLDSDILETKLIKYFQKIKNNYSNIERIYENYVTLKTYEREKQIEIEILKLNIINKCLKQEINYLKQENTKLKKMLNKYQMPREEEYEIIEYKGDKYFLINNKVYEINNYVGNYYADYDEKRNRIIKNKHLP